MLIVSFEFGADYHTVHVISSLRGWYNFDAKAPDNSSSSAVYNYTGEVS